MAGKKAIRGTATGGRKRGPPRMGAKEMARRRARFLEVLSQTFHVKKSYTAARIPRAVLYEWRRDDRDFAAAWALALEIAADVVEDEIVRRAIHGVPKDAKLVWSDRMLELLAKRAKPHLYRDRVAQEIELRGPTYGELVAAAIKAKADAGPRPAPVPGPVPREPLMIEHEVPALPAPPPADSEAAGQAGLRAIFDFE